MADSLLSFGVEKLWDLLVRESERFQGVEEQFNELNSDLNMLRGFLEDADAKKHTCAMVRNTVKEIKEIVYDAEDVIETFVLKEELGRTSGIKKRIRQLACVLAHRREIALDMEVLHNRIAKVIRDMQSLGVQQVIVNDGYMQSLQERQRQMRQTFSSDNNEIGLVGLEENVEKLVGHLVEEDGSQMVSITGMGGIGKTTLARQVFNHDTIKSHFASLAWVCVSQQFTRKYVWQTMLRKVGPEYINSEMTEDYVQETLYELLETRKALIVLDDIWREEDWDLIKPIFPPGKAWKVLLTSRNEGVGLRADQNCFTFKPYCLTFEESWSLFRRIVFPKENTAEMEELGKKIVKHCGGLPLAVKVLGGLLVEQYTLDEWKRIYEDIRSHIVGETNFNDNKISSIYHILSLSFEELPIYLKHCFLYLAHFPEDYAIKVEKLSCLWAAEGITRPRFNDGATVREVAYRYIEELVKRNMVISERDIATSRFESCHLHDMMREVCLRKAEEENFVHIVNTVNSHSPCNSRRIVIHGYVTSHPKWEMENPKLRSILFIDDINRGTQTGICFRRLQLMRILDLSGAMFEGGKLPSDIGKLIHLRYLNLCDAVVTHLPSSMRNLKQLRYLNLLVFWTSLCQVYVPNFMKEMRELTDLHLPKMMHCKIKLEMGNLVNLEKLENFSTENSSVKDLQRMQKLRNLSINGCLEEDIMSILEKLPQLKEVVVEDYAGKKMVCSGGGFPQLQVLALSKLYKWEEWIVEEGSMPLLHHLEIWNSPKLKKFPNGGFPQLNRLVLCGLEEWEEWIVEEGSMPLLHTLEIFRCPKLKKLPNGGFPQLQRLEFYGLKEWEEWIVEEDSMPLLHTLKIKFCPKLKKDPDGLRFLCSLKHLSIDKEWKERLSEGGEDYYKVKHIPSVEFLEDDEE